MRVRELAFLALAALVMLPSACVGPTTPPPTTGWTTHPVTSTTRLTPTATLHRPPPTTHPYPTRTLVPPSPCPTCKPTPSGPTTSGLVEALIEMPADVIQTSWSPSGADLALTDGASVFLARGPAFLVQEVLQSSQLFDQPYDDSILHWSPEGIYLEVHTRDHLWVVEAIGGQVVAEAPLSTEKWASWWYIDVDWSPDGQYLVYNDQEGLWLLDVSAGQHRLVFAIEEEDVGGGLWSPSGQYVAVTTYGTLHVTVSDIWILDRQGSTVCTWAIGPYAWNGGLRQWLDEQTLAWWRRCGTGCVDHGILDVTHCQEVSFTRFGAGYHWRSAGDYAAIDWAGLGQQAYLMDREARFLPLGDSPGCTYGPSGLGICEEEGAPPPLDPVEFQKLKRHQALAWSPDEQQLLLVAWDPEPLPPPRTCDLWTVTVPSLTHTHLLSDTCYGAWSPDGQFLSFVALGEPVMDEGGQILGVTTDPIPDPLDAHLGILDLSTRRLLLDLPFPVVISRSDAWPSLERHSWNQLFGAIWSNDSRYLLILNDGRLSLWRRGNRKVITVYQRVPYSANYGWAADSSAFYFSAEERSWVARLRQ